MKRSHATYFSRAVRDIPPEIHQVAVTFPPDWWEPVAGRVDKRLFPTRWTYRNRQAYREYLEELAASGVLKKIVRRLPDGCVLVGWYADPDRCDRTVILEVLKAHGLIDPASGEWIPPE